MVKLPESDDLSGKLQKYRTAQRSLKDRLEKMARDSEEILTKIYNALANEDPLEFSYNTGIENYSAPYKGVSFSASPAPNHRKNEDIRGVGYSIKLTYHQAAYSTYAAVFSIIPETKIEVDEKVFQRKGLSKVIWGPEEKVAIKKEVPTGKLNIFFRPGSQRGYNYAYGFRKYLERDEDVTLVTLAERIKEEGSIEDAEEFAEFNQLIRELPSKIVKHLEKRAGEVKKKEKLRPVKNMADLDFCDEMRTLDGVARSGLKEL